MHMLGEQNNLHATLGLLSDGSGGCVVAKESAGRACNRAMQWQQHGIVTGACRPALFPLLYSCCRTA